MGKLQEAIDSVERYLAAMEERDIERARACVVEGPLELTFPGGRFFNTLEQIVSNSASRYRFVKKIITRRDGHMEAEDAIVMISGTLYGEWSDGTPFEGIRFIDRFELCGARIRTQEVWNDVGHYLLSGRLQERP